MSEDEAEVLYRIMSVPDLVMLRHAFVSDRDGPEADEKSKAFCQGRIDAITRVLTERQKEMMRQP